MSETALIVLFDRISSEAGKPSLFEHPLEKRFLVCFDPDGCMQDHIGKATIKRHIARLCSYARLALTDEQIEDNPALRYRREAHARFFDSRGHTMQIPPASFYQIAEAFCTAVTEQYGLSEEDRDDVHVVMMSVANLMVVEHM